MDGEECRRVSFESMRTCLRAFAENAGGEVLETDEVLAAVNPNAAERSVFNSVVYSDPDALLAEVKRLARVYAARGCNWTVWVPEADAHTGPDLEAAGHRLDGTPRMMGARLDAITEPDLSGIDWEVVDDPAPANVLNDDGYGYPAGTWNRGIGDRPITSVPTRVYLARIEGQPASTVTAIRSGSDCAIWSVATAEAARGRGLAGALTAKACADARDWGCETTTLQASAMGAPVYRRVGFTDHGAFGMSERRAQS